jgi:3-ketosteroid 9alpha-monooxygenase subunit A
MRYPFTWRPTGWFMVAWSAEIDLGAVKPLKYFGQHMVAYRTEGGELHVLDAHCPHLGAHLGHGGKVKDDCIVCPYHGWGYGPDGVNRFIPYEDRPNVSHSLRKWHVDERHECVFVWHDPAGGPPRWTLPDIWTAREAMESTQEAHYRAYPEMSIAFPGEPVHPQIPLENAPDSVHFEYVHNATVTPELLSWGADGPVFRTVAGWRVPSTDGPGRVALQIESVACGVGGTFAYFEGSFTYRLAFFHTPVDDEKVDMFYSIWWPRESGDDSPTVPDHVRERAAKEYLSTLEDDLEIWRYQKYIEHPALAKQDAKPYGALRKWAKQFYEIDPD